MKVLINDDGSPNKIKRKPDQTVKGGKIAGKLSIDFG